MNFYIRTLKFNRLSKLSARDVKTGLPELMVNFVTSSYKPELLMPLVEKISDIPEVVSLEILYYNSSQT